MAWSIVGDGSIGPPSAHTLSFQLVTYMAQHFEKFAQTPDVHRRQFKAPPGKVRFPGWFGSQRVCIRWYDEQSGRAGAFTLSKGKSQPWWPFMRATPALGQRPPSR